MNEIGLSKRLKLLRIEFGYTQNEIANRIGVDKTTYAHYESGRRTPDAKKLKRLAELYNQRDELLGVTMPIEERVYYPKEELDSFESILEFCDNDNTNDFSTLKSYLEKMKEAYKPIEQRTMEACDFPQISNEDMLKYVGKTVKTIYFDVRVEQLLVRYLQLYDKIVNKIISKY